MAGRRGHQKGPQLHAEGQHGRATHQRHIELLQKSPQKEAREDRVERERRSAHDGTRRLVEFRQQHDEAEKGSESTQEERGRGPRRRR